MSVEDGNIADKVSKEFSQSELKRRMLYFTFALATLVAVSIIPTPMNPLAQKTIGVMAFVTILWITEAFPLGMTALFGISFFPVLNVLPLNESYFGFKNPALFFLIGALSLGIALQETNLHKRIALKLLERMGKSPDTIVLSVCILGVFTSFAMPCHAVAAILLPVLIGIVDAGNIDRNENFGVALFLALAFASSVGSIGTLLGGARNILAIGILESTTGTTLGFIDWAIAGVPIAIVLMFTTYITLKLTYPWGEVKVSKIREEIKSEVEEMGPMNRDEKKVIVIFTLIVGIWIFAGRRIGLSVIAVFGFFLLIASRTITWRDVKDNMPWGLVFLYGGALTLSHALTTTNAVEFLSGGFLGFLGSKPYVIVIVFLILVVAISNLMSNAAATSVILPIALPTIIALGKSDQLVTYLIAMGSAMVFLLPVGTPPNAIVYSSGYVELQDFVKAGLVLSVASIVIFITLGLGWWRLLGIW
ncbi:hypothetical protein AKJ51_02645 [candidate division MSBL1 archaeon SCGC-AAA382A20]|uniref:Anion transporter n=1 Tax=candidate division MSBL1 archaeon SCGC-AAA382A20 TaxID=1698280 RepID=A0A133VK91_9EURY|nr:hypothetical protein AKJ51_02645 [candidate division MSBL1 archaeon SCGC-AAA382A20]